MGWDFPQPGREIAPLSKPASSLASYHRKGAQMKREKGRKGIILTNEELKGAIGGTDSLPTSGDNGSGQQTDARAVIIDTGYS
jgi:hypothetical protein